MWRLAILLVVAQAVVLAQGAAPIPAVNDKETRKPEMKGKILGIGGIFFKSADAAQTREWYSKHLGLSDKGQGAILPWRDAGDPQTERMTVWSVFPETTKYLDPSKASFMINYIVDDMDALL